MRGTVKRWDPDRGFGFLATSSGKSIFAHISQCDDDLEELHVGDAVQFEIGEGRRPGTAEAKNISVI